MLARTSWTRTPQTPWMAAIVVNATLASSRSSTDLGVPSGAARREPRNDLRLEPTSTGAPSAFSSGSRWSSCQLWSAVLAKPSPGSTTIRSTGMPAATASSSRWASSLRTSPSTSSYDACCCITVEWARQCIATYAAPESATTCRIRGSAKPPETSLTRTAPDSRAARATSCRMVSTETATPSDARARITGITRSSSSATSGRVAPGRVDSPPMSSTSAPWSRRATACAMAASVETKRPPSENESGVTFTTPITSGRGRRGRPLAHDSRVVMAGRSAPGCVDQRHRLGTGRGAVHDAADGGGDRARARLAHPPHGHAQVLGLDHHDHAARLQQADQGVRDLGGEPLLHLRSLGVDVDEPGELGEPGDLAVLARDVADVRHPGERHEVVLAHRPELDVADQHHLVVAEVEGRGQHVRGGLAQAGGQLLVGAGHPGRGVPEPLTVGVLPEGDQQLPNRGRRAVVVERGHVGRSRGRVRHRRRI